VAGGVTAAYLDDSATYAPSGFASPSSITAPFLDGGVGFGHGVTSTTSTGLALYADGSALSNTLSRNFRTTRDDAGSFSFQMPRDVFTGVDFDDLITFKRDGVTIFAGIAEEITHDAIAQGEDASQLVTVSGRGSLALLDQAVVYPSRGVEALPIEEVRSFSWPSPDFDDSSWGLPKLINRQRSYAAWTTSEGAGPVPHIWPDTSGWWIWANQSTSTPLQAPVGECLFRADFAVSGATTVRVFCAFDNLGTLYIDGAEITAFQSFVTGQFVELDLSDGTHYIAASVTNTDPTGTYNPGGFIAAIYEVGDAGFLEDLILHTDATNWKCLPYPSVTPGFTHGQVLRILVEDAQDQDALTGVTLDFSDTVDSGGNAWSQYREITARVGRSLLEVVEEMANTFIDVEMAPGSKVLRAWNYGSRGSTRSVTLAQTTSPSTSDFYSLTHKGRRTRLNRALVRYTRGHLEETDSTSITAEGSKGGYLELGSVKGEAEARQIAANLIDTRAAESWSTSAVLVPSSSATTPFTSFLVGDTITCPDETDSNASMRVWSISMVEDEQGVITWPIELQDQAYVFEERLTAWLTRMSSGALMGGAKVSSPAGKPDPTAANIASLTVAEFSFDNSALVASYSPIRPAALSGNMVEIYGQLTTAGSSTTTVIVYQGTAVSGGTISSPTTLGTLTFASGVTEAEVALTIVVARANIDKFQCRISAVGTGAQGLDVQIRAI
jgi:hypothetical protein